MRRYCLVALGLLSVFWANAEGVKPECFPEETMAVIRLDATHLRMIPLMIELLDTKTKGYDIFVENVKNWVGFDIDAISVCWIGVCGNNRVILVFEGKFDRQAIMDKIPLIDKAQIVQRENSVFAFMLPDDKKPGEFNLAVLREDGTVVLGNPPLVDEFLAADAGHEAGLPPVSAAVVKELLNPRATVQAALLKLPQKELTKNPWMELLANGLIYADLDENLTVHLSLALAKKEALEPLQRMLSGFRDLYAVLDEKQKRLKPIFGALLEKGTVEVVQDRLEIGVVLDGVFAEGLIRDKWLH